MNYGKTSAPICNDVDVDNGDDIGVDNDVDYGDDVGVDNGVDNGDDVGVDNVVYDGVESNANKILSVIAEEPKITQKNLAIKTGLSMRTVSREIKELRDSGVMRRVGSDRSGYWEIGNFRASRKHR